MALGHSKVMARCTGFFRKLRLFILGLTEPDGWAPSRKYCERLIDVYSAQKVHDHRLSVPEWAVSTVESLLGESDKGVKRLQSLPRVQAALADVTSYTPSKWLLEQELSSRQSKTHVTEPTWNDFSKDVYDAANEAKLRGLAFSGGGIRSATFALGVLQALAAEDKLSHFDYLSTVSGGGYIHQFLASWILNSSGGLDEVQKLLKPIPGPGSPARMPSQLQWLRRYSNYLTPQRGLFSADTWTMVCIWFRNTFLNQLVLFGFLASCLLATRGLLYPFFSNKPYAIPILTSYHLGPILLVLYQLLACVIFGRAIYTQRALLVSPTLGPTPPVAPWPRVGDFGVVGFIILPAFLCSVYAGLVTLRHDKYATPLHLGVWASLILAMLLALTFGGLLPINNEKKKQKSLVIGLCLLSASGFAAAAYALGRYLASTSMGNCSRLSSFYWARAQQLNHLLSVTPDSSSMNAHLTAGAHAPSSLAVFTVMLPAKIGNPIIAGPITAEMLFSIATPIIYFAILFMALRLQIGVMGSSLAESRSEWLARLGAWSGLFGLGWIFLSCIALLGPPLCEWMLTSSPWHLLSTVAALIGVHAGTLYAGGSGKSDGAPKDGGLFGYSALDLLGMIGAPLCVASILVILSEIVNRAILLVTHNKGANGELMHVLYLAVVVVTIFVFFGWRVDVNQFSMHGFYRNRLARCYLGGTNPIRTADPFSGFDDHDDTQKKTGIKLSSLLPVNFSFGLLADETRKSSDDPIRRYDGPFPIFCSTLNLTFGEDLAYQERKGASFALTPLYSGYHVGWTRELTTKDEDTTFNGFVPTKDYAYSKGGINLSECAAVSGAALNPNRGVNTQPVLAFLMTLFNVRLGWWLANPRKPRVWHSDNRSATPWFGLRYLLGELFGMANDTSKFICLSDGGQFENMGLYELVRRRCSFIVVCDAESDPMCSFEGIGRAIAKCRLDFGAEISLPLDQLRPETVEPHLAKTHFVTGTIRYPAPPGSGLQSYEGRIFYLKATITGEETGDILHHRLTNSAFPNDSTLNQWFTESMFESYRRLGQIVGASAIIRF